MELQVLLWDRSSPKGWFFFGAYNGYGEKMRELFKESPLTAQEEGKDIILSPVAQELIKEIEGPPILHLTDGESYSDDWPVSYVEVATQPTPDYYKQKAVPSSRESVVYDAWAVPTDELEWGYSSR